MGLTPTKALSNVYCKARISAAKYNGKLNSREGAAELLGVSVGTVSDWELGVSRPSCENVIRMADLYGAPELMNRYCVNECPIGALTMQELSVHNLDRLTILIMAELRRSGALMDSLIEIAKAGITEPEMRMEAQSVINRLREIGKLGDEFQLLLDREA